MSRTTLYKVAREDERFPAVKIGGRVLIPVAELQAWLSGQVQREA